MSPEIPLPGVPAGLAMEPGWEGVFTRERAAGAMENGTRIKKIVHEQGDMHPMGARGTILGSLTAPGLRIAYFVEWDDQPKKAVGVSDYKIAAVAP